MPDYNDNDNNKHNDYICNPHKLYDIATIYPLSPCRAHCTECKKKNVHGYTNPNHGSNPFGYCYLYPMICISCSITHKKCMWCK
jgi:hypothetical protein